MDRIKRIYTYEDGTSNTGAMLGIFVVAIIALLAIAMAFWQPWNSQTPVTNETRIIQQPADAPDTTIINPPNTTIINPPAQNSEPSKTEININEGATGSPNSGTTTGGEASTTGG